MKSGALILGIVVSILLLATAGGLYVAAGNQSAQHYRTSIMNLYLATPSDAGKERLGADVEKLREDSVKYPPQIANALANMLAHAEVLLARQAPTDVLFHEATSNETAILADRLSGGFEHEIARQDARAANYEHGVLTVIGVLALSRVHRTPPGHKGQVHLYTQTAYQAIRQFPVTLNLGRKTAEVRLQEIYGNILSRRCMKERNFLPGFLANGSRISIVSSSMSSGRNFPAR